MVAFLFIIAVTAFTFRGDNSDRDDDTRSEGGRSISSEGGLKKKG